MRKDPDLKEKLRAAMDQFPGEYPDDFFEPEDDEKYSKDSVEILRELREFSSDNKFKNKKNTLTILREIRSGKKR